MKDTDSTDDCPNSNPEDRRTVRPLRLTPRQVTRRVRVFFEPRAEHEKLLLLVFIYVVGFWLLVTMLYTKSQWRVKAGVTRVDFVWGPSHTLVERAYLRRR